MKLIDFEKRLNLFRLYWGEDDLGTWWGDDWRDAPYQHNSERVYNRFICAITEYSRPLTDLILEAADDEDQYDFMWSKIHMRDREIPCLIIVPEEIRKDAFASMNSFTYWGLSDRGAIKLYFGDSYEKITALLGEGLKREEDETNGIWHHT